MYKQKWNISEGERIRILSLHEEATKKLYLVNEQTEVVIGTDKKNEEKKFPLQNLGDKFDYGVYDSPIVKSEIEKLKPQIENFIKKTDANQFVVNISAGESRVTNPKEFKVAGSLALARANSVKKYFEEIFPELIKNGTLKISSPSNIKDISIGKTPYTKGDQNNPILKEKYKKEQFVNFDIIGSGTKTTTTIKTKFLCDTKPLQNSGGFLTADSDFTQIVPWNVNKGEGVIYITYETYTMPDIIYFEYNGKVYGDTIFRGENSDPYKIFVGTALRAKFGISTLPKQMGENKVIGLNSTDDRIMKSLDDMKKWGMVESFQNTFGPNSSLSNPDWMRAFASFDKTGNKRKLMKELGEEFPWGYLTSKIGYSVNKIGPIEKIDGVDQIKVYNVAPVGTTKWSIYLNCETPK